MRGESTQGEHHGSVDATKIVIHRQNGASFGNGQRVSEAISQVQEVRLIDGSGRDIGAYLNASQMGSMRWNLTG